MKAKSNFIFLFFLMLAFAGISSFVGDECELGFCTTSSVFAQVNRGPATPKRDPIIEKESAHHLDVAWQYFKKKPDNKEAAERLNKAVESRLIEILDVNPDFSKIDQVYYLLGEVYVRLDDKDKAIHYFTKVVKDSSDSKYYRDAKKRLEDLQNSTADKSEKKEGNQSL